ncbi:hypothetical protein EJ08DRAFT_717050, partial [Tothia fuscella]
IFCCQCIKDQPSKRNNHKNQFQVRKFAKLYRFKNQLLIRGVSSLYTTPMAHAASPGAFLHHADGDVVISLSPKPEHNFTLHSKVLCKHSDFFRYGMKGEWLSNKVFGEKSIKGRMVQVKRYELKSEYQDGDSEQSQDDHNLNLPQQYDINEDTVLIGKAVETPADQRKYPSEQTVAAYKITFALMYEVETPLINAEAFDLVPPYDELQHFDGRRTPIHELHELLLYFRCYNSPRITVGLSSLILSTPNLGLEVVAERSFDFLPIACHLRSTQMYQVAFKSVLHYYFMEHVIEPSWWREEDYGGGWTHVEVYATDEEKDWKPWLELRYGSELFSQVVNAADEITPMYEEVRTKLLNMKIPRLSVAIQGSPYGGWHRTNCEWKFRDWTTKQLSDDYWVGAKSFNQHIKANTFWKLYMGVFKAEDIFNTHGGNMMSEVTKSSLRLMRARADEFFREAREIVTPLYEGFLETLPARAYVLVNVDPVPAFKLKEGGFPWTSSSA